MSAATLLIGTTEASVDDKRRIVIPSNLRPRFVDGCVLVNRGDHDGLYPVAEFVAAAQRVQERLDHPDPDSSDDELVALQDLATEMFSLATQGDLDANGRLRLARRPQFDGAERVVLRGKFKYLGIYLPDEVPEPLPRPDYVKGLARLGL